MKKGFKWFFLGTTTVCLSLSMLLPTNLYSAKAESTELNITSEESSKALELNNLEEDQETAVRQEEARLAE